MPLATFAPGRCLTEMKQILNGNTNLICIRRTAVRVSKILDIPVIVSEQYPQGLKHTGTLSSLPF